MVCRRSGSVQLEAHGSTWLCIVEPDIQPANVADSTMLPADVHMIAQHKGDLLLAMMMVMK